MKISWFIYLAAAGLAVTAALVFAVVVRGYLRRLVAGLRTRHEGLLGAVQLTQRQLTELRSAQDAIGARLAENSSRLVQISTRLEEKIDPSLDAVRGYLHSRQAAAEVERAREAGTLSQEAAERLLEELERVGEERLAGESPF